MILIQKQERDLAGLYRLLGLFAVFAFFCVGASFVQAGSDSSSDSGGGGGGSSYQESYNSYVAENACGCYSQSTLDSARSGDDVHSSDPGFYSSSENSVVGTYTVYPRTPGTIGYGSNVYGATGPGGATLTYANGLTVSGVSLNFDTLVTTGYAVVNGQSVQVTLTDPGNGGTPGNTAAVWSYDTPSYNPGSSSGGDSSSGGNGNQTGDGGTHTTLVGDQVVSSSSGGHYENQCTTSSGKGGGTSCQQVWVPDQTTGPCETSSCSSASNSFNVGNNANNDNLRGGPQGDLSIDASPRLIRSGDSSTVSWSSVNANSCTVAGPDDFSVAGASGSQVVSSIIQQSIYTLTCQFSSGVQTTSVTVNIIPVWREY